MNSIAKQIKVNRLRCNMTQERLAEALNVSSQAVSKWENGLSCPDISLLPELQQFSALPSMRFLTAALKRI